MPIPLATPFHPRAYVPGKSAGFGPQAHASRPEAASLVAFPSGTRPTIIIAVAPLVFLSLLSLESHPTVVLIGVALFLGRRFCDDI